MADAFGHMMFNIKSAAHVTAAISGRHGSMIAALVSNGEAEPAYQLLNELVSEKARPKVGRGRRLPLPPLRGGSDDA